MNNEPPITHNVGCVVEEHRVPALQVDVQNRHVDEVGDVGESAQGHKRPERQYAVHKT